MTKRKIFLVRDKIEAGTVLQTELRIRDFEVDEFVFDPDGAYEVLSREKGDSLVVVNSMLVGKLKGDNRRYTDQNTFGFLQTGVTLLRDLSKSNPGKFPQHSMMYTISDQKNRSYQGVKMFCDKFDIPLIEGYNLWCLYSFGEAVERRYTELFGSREQPAEQSSERSSAE